MIQGNDEKRNDEKLVGAGRIGDFVHDTQEMAKKEGFGHVAKKWFVDGTLPISEELERLAATRGERETIYTTVQKLEPSRVGGRFALRDERGRELFPDDYSIGQLGSMFDIGSLYARRLFEWHDEDSIEMLEMVFDHARQQAAPDKACMLKVEQGEKLRAVLPPGHCHLRNDWYLGVLERAVPGGRLSHWKGDEYTLYGNLLIPDTIRQESDSEYGGMISISNCEVGLRPFSQRLSLYRAICQNGCIWDQTKGRAFKLKQLGVIEPAELEKLLIKHIQEQIPLIDVGLQTMLRTRSFESNVAMKPVFAQVCSDRRISRDLASTVLNSWFEEKAAVPELGNTLFSVINAFTRAGQRQSNDTWVRFDEIGGELARMKRDDWESLVSRASELSAKKVEGAFAGFTADIAAGTSA